jgi:hypothetical protein
MKHSAFFIGALAFFFVTQIAVASTIPTCSRVIATLKPGDTDARTNGQVSVLQLALTEYFGTSPAGSVTGTYGKKTQASVVQFQKTQGLPPGGVFGERTKKAMRTWCTATISQTRVNVPGGTASVGNEVQTTVTPPKIPSSVTSQTPITKEKFQDAFSDGMKICAAQSFMTFISYYYDVKHAFPVYTTPTAFDAVLPSVMDTITPKIVEESEGKTTPEKVAQRIPDLQTFAKDLVYQSDQSGRSFCLSFDLKLAGDDAIMRSLQETQEKMPCQLPPIGKNTGLGLTDVAAQKLLTEVAQEREKLKEIRKVSDVKMVQIALELYYDQAGHYPVRSSVVDVAALVELMPQFISKLPAGVSYTSDAVGKTYCMGATTGVETAKRTQTASCPTGLTLPSSVNYLVTP